MNKNEILSEANKLVSNGLRKAAIDLLLEYLETVPNSSTILSVLGRAYLLDHQPEKAVIYLKRSLEVAKAIQSPTSDSIKYHANNFENDDIDYINSQADQSLEKEYRFEDDEPAPKNGEVRISEQPDRRSLFKHPQETYWTGDEENLTQDNETTSQELFIDDADEEELFDETLAPVLHPSLEEEFDELSWDDLDELDEFDEFAQREVEKEVQDKGKISRDARAQQIAIIVLTESDWDPKHLPLLQQVFFENGWSAARIAIEKEIEKGLLPEELALARKIRILWSENERYWMTFHKIKTSNYAGQADAAYKHMSWLESLRIIRCFPSLPDIEEIYTLIDEAFEIWYNSNRLRKIFKAFFKFLKYRTGSIPRTLPGECPFFFRESADANIGVDFDTLRNPINLSSQELLELGLQISQWPRPSENKFHII